MCFRARTPSHWGVVRSDEDSGAGDLQEGLVAWAEHVGAGDALVNKSAGERPAFLVDPLLAGRDLVLGPGCRSKVGRVASSGASHQATRVSGG